jgi:glycosyltransferase involved in cell wall biosynthesis
LIREWNPDVVYVCAIGIRNWVGNIRRTRHPIFLVEQSELRSSIANNPLPRKLLDRLLEFTTIFLFDGQVCASRYLQRVYQNWMRKSFKRKPILYSPYAYNPNLLTPNQTLVEKLTVDYRNKKVILYMGTLATNYGIMDILKAVDILRQVRQDFILLVLGQGRDGDAARKFVIDRQLNGSVQMLGYVPEEDLPSYFKVADAFVCPLFDTIQDWARCPSKLFMYILFNKPILTCKIGEAIELLGDNDFYFTPKNTDELCQRLGQALDGSKSLRPNCNPQSHSWDTRAHDFLKWLHENWSV